MRNLAVRLKSQGKPIVNLAAGELDGSIGILVKQAAIQAVLDGTNKYTETIGTDALRDALAAVVAQQTGLDWTAKEIAVTAGAKQALYNTAMVLFDAGDEVIIPSPHWTTFPAQVVLAGATPVFVDTAAHGYRLSAARIAQQLSARTKAIVLNTPNNPTGAVIDAATLVQIAELAQRHGVWVVFDQCYAAFVYGNAMQANLLQVAPFLRERTVIVDSFSKSHALAGWRIGYMAAPAAVVTAVANLQSHTTSNPNAIAQAAALAVLRQSSSAETIATLRELDDKRRLALGLMAGIRGVDIVEPEGGFYLYVKVRAAQPVDADNADNADNGLAYQVLEHAGVAVVGGDAFGDPNALRISYAVGRSELEQGLQRLARYLRSFCGANGG